MWTIVIDDPVIRLSVCHVGWLSKNGWTDWRLVCSGDPINIVSDGVSILYGEGGWDSKWSLPNYFGHLFPNKTAVRKCKKKYEISKEDLLTKKIPDKETIAEESWWLKAELEYMFHATDEAVFTT